MGNVPSWTPRRKSFPAWASTPSLPVNAPLWAQGLCMCLIPLCCSDRPWSPGSCQMAEAFPLAQDGAPEASSPPCPLPRMAWNRGLADQRWASAGRQPGRMEVSAPSRGREVRLLGSYPRQASTVLDTQRATEMYQVAVGLVCWVSLIPGSPKGKRPATLASFALCQGPHNREIHGQRSALSVGAHPGWGAVLKGGHRVTCSLSADKAGLAEQDGEAEEWGGRRRLTHLADRLLRNTNK